ncbi:hypothetical protein B0H17DRAFT_1326397 [Mycena rosella]|uniref:DUF6533 domain-containing protein n=1 Tax=Mycena rosella TaxID=1033263 RepID=A0AAD7GTG4_MYCRO|nr:hypothetical protein B0H17DRAFT_1326397 [Mycena rosella]
MSSSAELAAAVDSANETFANNCATAAFVTILVYDWLLTLRSEVEYIWRQKMSFVSFALTKFCLVDNKQGKLLYFLASSVEYSSAPPSHSSSVIQNRYLVIIDLVILLNSYANPIIHGSKVCVPWFHIDSWLGVVSIVSIDTIMLIRTWAMWHRSKKVLVLLLSLQALCNLAEAGATLWASLTLFSIPSPNNIRPCLTGFARPNVLYALWMGVVVWDFVIMIFTLVRAIPTMRLNRAASPMIGLILRDGIQYFILMLFIALGNIVVLNVAPGPLATMLLTLQRVTNSVIGSRIMLNLRGMLLNPSYNSRTGSGTLEGSTTLELSVRVNRSVYSNEYSLGK